MTRAVILGQSEVWKRRLWQLSIFVPTSLKNTKCVPVIYASYCFSDYLKIFCSCKDVWEEFRHLKTNISKYKLSSETERNSFHTHTHTHTHKHIHTHFWLSQKTNMTRPQWCTKLLHIYATSRRQTLDMKRILTIFWALSFYYVSPPKFSERLIY
jgi:hypothetical protein